MQQDISNMYKIDMYGELGPVIIWKLGVFYCNFFLILTIWNQIQAVCTIINH
jgi:hypothetical protein